jgi:hypothetical protein
LFGLLATAIGRLYHAPRVLHAMSCDGLLPRALGRVSLSATPVIATLLTALLAAVLALCLDFRCLLEMSAIAVLLEFLISAIIVLHVRYQPDVIGLVREYSDLDLSCDDVMARAESPKLVLMANGDLHVHYKEDSKMARSGSRMSGLMETSSLFPNGSTGGDRHSYVEDDGLGLDSAGTGQGGGGGGGRTVVVRSTSSLSSLVHLSSCSKVAPDPSTWHTARVLLLVFLFASTTLAATTSSWPGPEESSWWAVTLVCVSAALMVAAALGLARQPQNDARLYFKTPYVPLVPLLAVLLCSVMLASLPVLAWLRLAVWTVLGMYDVCVT